MSEILPLPPTSVTLFDPNTGTINPQWQNFFLSLGNIGGDFAPIDAQYWVSTSDGTLTNERNIGALSTGYLKITTAVGVATPSSTATIPGTDITGAALTKTDDTNVTLTLGGTPATALLRAASLTLGWTGTLGLARGGTNANLSATGGTSQVLKQSTVGGAVTVGQLSASDISGGGTVTSVAMTVPGGFSISGSPVTTSGTLALAANGTSGGVPYYSGATTMASSAALAANAIVFGGGAGAAPATNSNFTVNTTSNMVSGATQGRSSAYNSGTQSINNSTDTALTFDSEDYDVGAYHLTGSDPSRFTVPTGGDGFYIMYGGTTFAAGGGLAAVEFRKNGTTVYPTTVFHPNTASGLALQCMAADALVATDYIELIAFQSSGGALNVGSATKHNASSATLIKVW